MANGNGISGSLMGRILNSLENRVILLIVAGILGVSGNQVLQILEQSTVRPDPYTGTEGRAVEKRVYELEKIQALDNEHRLRSNEGWKLIYQMHNDIAVIKEQIKNHVEHKDG